MLPDDLTPTTGEPDTPEQMESPPSSVDASELDGPQDSDVADDPEAAAEKTVDPPEEEPELLADQVIQPSDETSAVTPEATSEPSEPSQEEPDQEEEFAQEEEPHESPEDEAPDQDEPVPEPEESPAATEQEHEEEGAAEPTAEGSAQAEEAVLTNKKWYVVKVQSGREESIKEAIERKVKIEGLEEFYGQIYIPTEKVTEVKTVRKEGKTTQQRVTREKKVLPGYFMAEVEYNDRILYLFRETSGVGDFVGATPNREPPPMNAKEIERWMGEKGQPDKEVEKPPMERGDRVRVKDGTFVDMEGEVQEVLETKKMVRIELTIFGRPVPVELEYWQVEQL